MSGSGSHICTDSSGNRKELWSSGTRRELHHSVTTSISLPSFHVPCCFSLKLILSNHLSSMILCSKWIAGLIALLLSVLSQLLNIVIKFTHNPPKLIYFSIQINLFVTDLLFFFKVCLRTAGCISHCIIYLLKLDFPCLRNVFYHKLTIAQFFSTYLTGLLNSEGWKLVLRYVFCYAASGSLLA